MPSLLQSSAVALHHCTEMGLNKVYFKNRWQNPGAVPQAGKGLLFIPPSLYCSQRAQRCRGCARPPLCVSLQSAGAEEAATPRRETGNNYLQPPQPAVPSSAGRASAAKLPF